MLSFVFIWTLNKAFGEMHGYTAAEIDLFNKGKSIKPKFVTKMLNKCCRNISGVL
jgi:hypothetical protein